jgi:hypothetical protein
LYRQPINFRKSIMKTKFIAATVIAFAATSSVGAFAMTHQYGEAALVAGPDTSTSTVSRSQVQADYLQARRNGALPASNEAALTTAPAATGKVTRSEVRTQAAMSAMTDGRSAL